RREAAQPRSGPVQTRTAPLHLRLRHPLMHITVYSHYFVPEIGAPSARISDFGREWIRGGHQVRVVTCFPNHPAGEIYPGYRAGLSLRETIDGMDVRRLWSFITPNRGVIKRTLGHLS